MKGWEEKNRGGGDGSGGGKEAEPVTGRNKDRKVTDRAGLPTFKRNSPVS